MRPGYRPAFDAWRALRPLKNPNAPPDPSYLPQYRIPQEAQGKTLTAKADAYFDEGQSAASTADKYVRLTVLLAAVLFLGGVQLISVGILGRYLARVHEQTLHRPLYLVARVVSGPGRPPAQPGDHAPELHLPRA